MMKRAFALVLFVVLCVSSSKASAQWQERGHRGGFLFGGRFLQNRETHPPRQFNHHRLPNHYHGSIRQQDPYNFYDTSELYPKYYGAFHYSHFSRMGVPAGDIGLRGNGIYWSPW